MSNFGSSVKIHLVEQGDHMKK